MKKIVLSATAFFLLIACNQSGQKSDTTSSSDTSSHSARHNDNNDNNSQSMMGLMERNMDQMKELRSLGSSDKDFASMMKIHHLGAVEMARLQVAQGTDQEVKAMAQKMIVDQQREINDMDAFLASDSLNSAATEKSSPFYDGVMKEMDNMKMDHASHTGSVDRQFVQMMIPHHQGAITMAELYLKTGAVDPKLKSMANQLKTEQQKEIQQMQALQASLQ